MTFAVRNILIGFAASGAFFLFVYYALAGYLMAIAAPLWILPMLSQPLGMAIWYLLTYYFPIAISAAAVAALIAPAARHGSDSLLLGLICGWVGGYLVAAIVDWPLSPLSTVHSWLALCLGLTLPVFGFVLGGKTYGRP